MKITVKPNETTEEIEYKDIEPGVVFESGDGQYMLKLTEGNAVLLTYQDKSPWFGLADGYKDCPVARILGRIEEIIVREIK